MEQHSENILSQKSIQEMIMVANEYCHFIEEAETHSKDIIVSILQKLMPLLYLKGALLPTVQVSNPDANMHFVTEEEWFHVHQTLLNKFGEDDAVSFQDVETNGSDDSAAQSISEDLADIYQDMKDCIKLLQINTKDAQENAISELQQLFVEHWGLRVCRIQYSIHLLEMKK